MTSFTFTLKESLSPQTAGQLVKEALKCSSSITVRKGEKTGDAKLIFHVLTLSAKSGDELELTAEGTEEQADIAYLKAFVLENL